jgi:hypothetical protein
VYIVFQCSIPQPDIPSPSHGRFYCQTRPNDVARAARSTPGSECWTEDLPESHMKLHSSRLMNRHDIDPSTRLTRQLCLAEGLHEWHMMLQSNHCCSRGAGWGGGGVGWGLACDEAVPSQCIHTVLDSMFRRCYVRSPSQQNTCPMGKNLIRRTPRLRRFRIARRGRRWRPFQR